MQRDEERYGDKDPLWVYVDVLFYCHLIVLSLLGTWAGVGFLCCALNEAVAHKRKISSFFSEILNILNQTGWKQMLFKVFTLLWHYDRHSYTLQE